MNIVEYIPENIVPILVFAVLITLIFQLIRRRSLKGAMFGAEITETVGSFEIWKSSAGKRVLSVHRLKEEEENDRAVGIDITSSGFGSFRITPITLSSEQARKLAEMLDEATT